VAKVTEEYVRVAFYRRFASLNCWQQDGIIEGLKTIRDVQMSSPMVLPAPLPGKGEAQPAVSAIEAADLEGVTDGE
jgi:hypothetical protein